MTLSSLIGIASVGSPLTIWGGHRAPQALDAAWLVGNWRSALEDPRARTRFQGEIHLNSDGTFEGGVQSDLAGSWRIRTANGRSGEAQSRSRMA